MRAHHRTKEKIIRKLILSLLPWAIALGLLFWILSSVSLAETWDVLSRLQPAQFFLLAILNGLVLLTLNGRWWLILRGFGYDLPYLTLTGYRLAAFGVSYFTPGPLFGGEPLQVYLIERNHEVPRAVAIAVIALEKSLDLLANFIFLAVALTLILQTQLFDSQLGTEAVLFTLLLLGIPLGFLLMIWAGWHPLSSLLSLATKLPLLQTRPRWLAAYQKACQTIRESERQTTRFCRQAPISLALALFISLLGWVLMIAEYWLMLTFLAPQLTLIQVIIAMTAARIALLFLLPGGLGTLEASQVLTLNSMGLNPAIAVSISLLIRIRDVLLAGFGLWWASKKLQGQRQRPPNPLNPPLPIMGEGEDLPRNEDNN